MISELDQLKKDVIDAHFAYHEKMNQCLRGQRSITILQDHMGSVLHRMQKLHAHPDFLPNQAPKPETKKLLYNIT